MGSLSYLLDSATILWCGIPALQELCFRPKDTPSGWSMERNRPAARLLQAALSGHIMSNGVAPQGHRLDDVTNSSWNRSSLRGAEFVPELAETCRSAYGLGLLSTGGSSTRPAGCCPA